MVCFAGEASTSLFVLDGHHLAALGGTAVSAGHVHADIAADSVDDVPAVALAERVGDFNISMDPWEQTVERRLKVGRLTRARR